MGEGGKIGDGISGRSTAGSVYRQVQKEGAGGQQPAGLAAVAAAG